MHECPPTLPRPQASITFWGGKDRHFSTQPKAVPLMVWERGGRDLIGTEVMSQDLSSCHHV